uniref:Uncharacterized protein n=1 Tax=Siphoviridae sp. ct73V17 TaxID=2826302 RepID=A0A8S5M6B8_9CAUD|nr:MAG TPA: hypothetical protein [Siphoviridae sp. ct73V17]DAN66976.1 MAG TPA: hypothetical protein [Caudoviricetes sp.]
MKNAKTFCSLLLCKLLRIYTPCGAKRITCKNIKFYFIIITIKNLFIFDSKSKSYIKRRSGIIKIKID